MIDNLAQKVKQRCANARSIHEIIITEKFSDLYGSSTDSEKKRIESIILANSAEELKAWVRTHPAAALETLSYGRLRERAKRLQIQNYSRMMKGELIEAIRSKQ